MSGKHILLMKPYGTVQIRQYSADGAVVAETVTDVPYCELSLDGRTASVSVEGKADIYEIL